MANHQLLDNITHKDLRIITDRAAWYGDDVACTGVFPLEFRRLQAEYPIAFQKNAKTGSFDSVAVFGFVEGENMFLGPDGWEAGYVPLSIERQPFLIGFQSTTDDGGPGDEPVVHIDMDSPRISETEGMPVFLEHGGHSPYLEHINSVLKAIYEGYQQNREFSEALAEFDLLEPFTLEVELQDGSKQRLSGLHTINEPNLNALDGNALARLHGNGFLEHIYMVMASVANFRTLIDKKNALL
jgi:hypothetical protein